VVELPQRLFRLSIDFRPLRIAEVLGVLVGRPCACARRVLAPGRLRSRQIALPYRLEVRVKLRYVCPLRQSAAMARMLPTSNVSYNAVRLFEKLIQVLCTKHVGLDRPSNVLCQHLIEDGRDVHGVVLHFGLAGQMTMLPRPARLAPPIDCQPWHPFSHPPILPLCPLHVTPACHERPSPFHWFLPSDMFPIPWLAPTELESYNPSDTECNIGAGDALNLCRGILGVASGLNALNPRTQISP
jgi:hypothetical protein